jgi:hypothetical protein
MMKFRFTAALCGAAFFPSLAMAQNAVSVATLSSFGNGGYLAPIGAANAQRGLAFNPLGTYDSGNSAQYGGGDLYTALNNGTIDILSAATGAIGGTLGSSSSYSGGTFVTDSIAVAADGAIYVDNLTTNSSSSPYKIYEYANEAAGSGAPTVVFSGNADGARLGDDLAVYGTGASTLLASGFASVANGYAITSITNSTGTTGNTTTYATFTGSSNFKDFSAGITFAANANNVLGSQLSLAGVYRDTTYTTGSTTGTLVASPSLVTTAGNANAGGEHLMAYDVVDGVPLLAVQSTGDGHVSLYDDTNPASPILLQQVSLPATDTTTSGNGNATGAIAFGSVYNTDQVNLYTLSTNEGINAYTVTVTPASVPEPASLAVLGLAVPALMARRRGR